MPPPLILDPETLDLSRVIADQEAIRRANPHRGHMEHLTARHQQFQARTGGQQLHQEWRCHDHLLEVVEHEQPVALT